MPIRILIADDDDEWLKAHKFAIEAASELLKGEYAVVESETSIDAWEKISSEPFDLIVMDNDFKDTHLRGHLPGIALLELARKEGENKATPIIFCSAETFETLKPMVERFKGIYFPKADYDIDRSARLLVEQLTKSHK